MRVIGFIVRTLLYAFVAVAWVSVVLLVLAWEQITRIGHGGCGDRSTGCRWLAAVVSLGTTL